MHIQVVGHIIKIITGQSPSIIEKITKNVVMDIISNSMKDIKPVQISCHRRERDSVGHKEIPGFIYFKTKMDVINKSFGFFQELIVVPEGLKLLVVVSNIIKDASKLHKG